MARTNAERLDELTAKVDGIITHLETLTTIPLPTPTPTPPPQPPPPPQHLPRMKLDVPKFDGTDAMGWIFNISQFFDYHQTPEDERLTVASFYMDGPALSWYQSMHRNNQIHTWFSFLQALEMRFAPSYYDEPSSALFKLTQKTSVNTYLNEFERLANRIALRPLTLPQAMTLAKLQEDKIEDRRRLFKTKHQPSTIINNTSHSSSNIPLLPTPKSPNKVNFRKLSSEEMPDRRQKGLCYNCDETFTRQHKCKGRFFLLIADNDTDLEDPPTPPSTIDTSPPTSPPAIIDPSEAQISFHAMSGTNVPTIIRIPGHLANHPVTVLIDGGSTHNFIQTRLAKFLGLPSNPANTLKVMVGNGSILNCYGLCASTPLTLHKEKFEVDLYTLPLCGADVVLGVHWLQSIGPVLMDYTSLSLSYTLNNKTITLSGNPPSKPNGYATIALPLTSLLRKDAFNWTEAASQAFIALKSAMTHAPTFALPDFSQPFVLETDASGLAMGAVLMQDHHPIAFFSKPFCTRLRRSSTYIRELHAITTIVKKWRQYLLGHPFIIYTDHQSLKELLTQAVQTPEQQIYLAKLMGYEYSIQYKTGKSNVVADALSRLPETTSSMTLSLTMPNFIFLEHLKLALAACEPFNTLFNNIQTNPYSFPYYKIHNGLILFQNRIWLDFSMPFRLTILEDFHASPVGGHMGITKTLARLQANFDWANMHKDVQTFISQCSVCQQVKYETRKTPGLLHPLPIPTAIWEDLSLDFITGLPKSQTYTTILVVVDRFSKGIHLAPLHPNYTAHNVATIFFDTTCKLHGIPRSLVSDRDPLFISKFWKELFALCGTKLRMSTSYHPETDGQTEVINRVLEQYLRSSVHHKPSLWAKFLPLAEWAYNTSKHSSTGFSRFHLTYGKEPPSIPQYLQGSSPVEAVDTWLKTRQALIIKLRQNLLKTQEKMKFYANKNRRPVTFDVGQFVYVRLRPYRQTSVTAQTYSKLTKRFYGPYRVLDKIGPLAYRLELPPTSKIHLVFHCSLLKLHKGPLPLSASLPPNAVDHQSLIEPLTILAHKIDASTNPLTPMVLVQWSGLPLEDTSWEPWDTLQRTYHLEDKVPFPDEGNVSTSTTEAAGPSTTIAQSKPKRITIKPARFKDYA
ncbi:hypothetical protein TSUD_164620 [Trifolium subterraneum]|uniref:Integrase catalytic domain-containing protein n=1 Tax=Trifolium subterraneum TaxID=3900 RepID=A0A2Z6MXQ7_TRISU|nr:hypothetical protein TSUD_164620 [Trifolium subterraneum]